MIFCGYYPCCIKRKNKRSPIVPDLDLLVLALVKPCPSDQLEPCPSDQLEPCPSDQLEPCPSDQLEPCPSAICLDFGCCQKSEDESPISVMKSCYFPECPGTTYDDEDDHEGWIIVNEGKAQQHKDAHKDAPIMCG